MGVSEGEIVGVRVGVTVVEGDSETVGDAVGVGVGVLDGEGEGVGVGDSVSVYDAVGVGDCVGVEVGVRDGVSVGVGVSDAVAEENKPFGAGKTLRHTARKAIRQLKRMGVTEMDWCQSRRCG